MERRWMKTGRVLAMIAIAAGLATVFLTSLNAQEPTKPSARQALRQRIADLRGEVQLLGVEHDVERDILKQELMRSPLLQKEARDLVTKFAGATADPELASKLSLEFEIDMMLWIAREVNLDAARRNLAHALEEAKKSGGVEEVRKAFKGWLDSSPTWIKTEFDKELAPLKKAFVRHASELCLKKLELEDLEKQYRDSR